MRHRDSEARLVLAGNYALIGSYMNRLKEFGLRAPSRLPDVARFVKDMHHSAALALAAIRPLNFWRYALKFAVAVRG